MSRLNILWRRCAVLTVTALCFLTASVQAGDKVEIRKGESSTLDITVNGQPFAVYNYGETLPKPYLLPVRTAAGVVINRELGDPSDADHPHHKGMWNAIDEVNGVKFWAEKGVIRNTQVVIHSTDAESASLQATNEWLNPETEKPEVIEKALITFFPNRLIIYDMTFTAPGHEVVFEDTKEGLFGFRVAPSMKEKNGGRVVASDGSKTTANCWGKSFPWIDYSGEVNGKTVGVTIMDHPKNFRPSRYHVRDYGLFSISPFGEKAYTNGASEAAPVHLKAGESLRLRYAIYFHDGDAEAAQPQKAYEQFVKAESP